MSTARPATPTFSLTAGGPFYRLLTRFRLRTPHSMARCWWLGVAVWLPYVVGEGIRGALGLPPDKAVHDLSLHARLLVMLPLLLSSELLLERAARSAMSSMYYGDFADRSELDRIVAAAHRLRDSWGAEAVLLAVAIVGGQLVLWGAVGATGVFYGVQDVGRWTFPRVWYAVVGLPLVQFVMFRWLWRWVIWSYVLVRLARLPLHLIATHADGAAGLAALARPVSGFAGFVFATSATLSAAWATQMLAHEKTITDLLPMLVTVLLTDLLIAVGPLLLLSGHLFRARRTSLAQYGDFMRDYIVRFHEKWIHKPLTADPLGTSDIQSLADMGNSYSVASKTRLFAFGPRVVLMVWAAGIIPMLPLLASALTFEEILKRIVSTVLGGFPI